MKNRFNGAGMFPSQKLTNGCAIQNQTDSFNGAGMFPSQKYQNLNSGKFGRMVLQWGRDVSIPEMPPAGFHISAIGWLQWGRDVSIPEINYGANLGYLYQCFNGAGMFPSQK